MCDRGSEVFFIPLQETGSGVDYSSPDKPEFSYSVSDLH